MFNKPEQTARRGRPRNVGLSMAFLNQFPIRSNMYINTHPLPIQREAPSNTAQIKPLSQLSQPMTSSFNMASIYMTRYTPCG
jgi:hypothetical protein